MRINQFWTITLFFLIFFGCFEYEEQLVLNQDGSGEITLTFAVPLEFVESDETFTSENMFKSMMHTDGFTILDTKEWEKDDKKYFESSISFSSINDFNKIKDKQLSEFLGKMSLTEENGVWTFTKQLGKPSENKNDNDKAIMKSMFSGIEWQYTITFPYNVVQVEADHGEVVVNGNSVSWEVGLSEFAGGVATLNVQIKKGSTFKSMPKLQTLYLKNGDVVKGEILSINRKICLIKLENRRERISRDEIKSIDF